jgi:hypothetical protein
VNQDQELHQEALKSTCAETLIVEGRFEIPLKISQESNLIVPHAQTAIIHQNPSVLQMGRRTISARTKIVVGILVSLLRIKRKMKPIASHPQRVRAVQTAKVLGLERKESVNKLMRRNITVMTVNDRLLNQLKISQKLSTLLALNVTPIKLGNMAKSMVVNITDVINALISILIIRTILPAQIVIVSRLEKLV